MPEQEYPCARCGRAIVRRSGPGRPRKFCSDSCRKPPASPTAGAHATCVMCGDPTGGQRFCGAMCQDAHAWTRRLAPVYIVDCAQCGQPFAKLRGQRRECCTPECKRRRKALQDRARYRPEKQRVKWQRRRTADKHTDLTTADSERLSRVRKCQLCGVYMTKKPGPRQRHLDHIVPVCLGGTTTYGNVRMVCRTCNLSRPKDGSDVEMATLWAQTPSALPQRDSRLNRAGGVGSVPYGPSKGEWRRHNVQRRTSARRAQARRHAAEALAMRRAGHGWQHIASTLGYRSIGSTVTAVRHYWPDEDLPALVVSRNGTHLRIATDADAAERYGQAMRYRAAGLTWSEIAMRMGYANARSARRCMRSARARLKGGDGVAA